MDVVRGAALSYQSKSSLALAFLTFGVRLDSVVVFGEDSESARPCVFPCVPRGSVCFIYFYGPGDREPVDGPTDKGREFIRFIFSPSLAAALAADSPFPPLPQKEKKKHPHPACAEKKKEDERASGSVGFGRCLMLVKYVTVASCGGSSSIDLTRSVENFATIWYTPRRSRFGITGKKVKRSISVFIHLVKRMRRGEKEHAF